MPFLLCVLFASAQSGCPASASIDGANYNVVRIGSRCWLTSNMYNKHYADGTPVSPAQMRFSSAQYPNVDSAKYGFLYTPAADTRNRTLVDDPVQGLQIQGICPEGWRIPTQADMELLMAEVANSKQLMSCVEWLPTGGTNTLGFNMLPTGIYNSATEQFEDFYTSTVLLTAETSGTMIYHPCKFGAFCGTWEYVPGTSYANQAAITTNGNLTLYAQWHTWCTGTPNTSVNELGTSRIDSVKDHQNNWYKVVQIGNQCWTKENMRATTEPGSATQIALNSEASLTEPRIYSIDNDYVAKYGYLYNFPAAMNTSGDDNRLTYPHRGICPEGWHVPTVDDWELLAATANVPDYLYVPVTAEPTNGLGKLTGGSDWETSTRETAPRLLQLHLQRFHRLLRTLRRRLL